MPGRNGTGPMGAGAMTGRGNGPCAEVGLACGRGFGRGQGRGHGRCLNFGQNYGFGHGFGRSFARFSADENITAEERMEILKAHKDALQERLAEIDRQMEAL